MSMIYFDITLYFTISKCWYTEVHTAVSYTLNICLISFLFQMNHRKFLDRSTEALEESLRAAAGPLLCSQGALGQRCRWLRDEDWLWRMNISGPKHGDLCDSFGDEFPMDKNTG